MITRTGVILALLLVFPAFSQAQSTVTLPEDTTVAAVKYGEPETEVTLKAPEQVAFLFVYTIWSLEEKCLDARSGVGRLSTLGELLKGVKTKDGRTIGLTINPARDTNYRYDVMIVGNDCLIRAVPRGQGLGAFAVMGSPKGFASNFYYNPKGPDLVPAVKLTEMGYSGSGFRL